MMLTVASHKAENRMSTSAVAACMAPLLLRPLLAGDCEIQNDFDVGGDGSVQLLQAAAAANHAQAIVITLLEDYDNIFGVISSILHTSNCLYGFLLLLSHIPNTATHPFVSCASNDIWLFFLH